MGPTHVPQYYLNEHGDSRGCFNNQLFHFNPVSSEWTNLKCLGVVPTPRSYHATTVFGDKVWLYGGQTQGITCDDLYQLDMCSLTWTQIQTMTLKPGRMQGCSLNVMRENQLVLHGGKDENTWILDLSSYSWKKCTYDSFRRHHTGSLGINNNIIVIGGICPKDDLKPHSEQCLPMCNIALEPKSLQQLSIKTVYMYRGQLPWKHLPKKLINLITWGQQ